MQRSTRSGGFAVRILKRVYFPIEPARVTVMTMRVPARSWRSRERTRSSLELLTLRGRYVRAVNAQLRPAHLMRIVAVLDAAMLKSLTRTPSWK